MPLPIWPVFLLLFPLTPTSATPLISQSSPLRPRATSSEGPQPFLGTGKIGLYHDATGEYMGCSTTEGLWTVEDSQCGIFTGTLASDGTSYEVSSSKGTCATSNEADGGKRAGTFGCGLGEMTKYFTVDLGFGHRLACCGDLYMSYSAGQAVYPIGSETIPIHLWGSGDSGKFVQLGWNATNA